MRGQWRFAVMILAALLVVFAVWTWLPPDDATQNTVKSTLVAFESQASVLWPQERLGDGALTQPQVDQLLEDRAAAWRAVADEEALLEKLRTDEAVVRAALEEQDVVVAVGGDVPYFDVRRRTTKGELLVRAAVVTWVEAGRWTPRVGEIVDVTRRTYPSAPITDYTLSQTGGSWRVVAASPVDEAPFFYDVETGETGTGP